jgi:hypothetical protein
MCLVNGFADKVLCWSADRAATSQSSQLARTLTESHLLISCVVSHSR